MKKKFLFGMALSCSALLLAGCGIEDFKDEEEDKPKEEVLVCTQKETDSGMDMTLEMSFVYNNSKKEITDGNMKVTIDVGEDNIKLFEDKNLCDEYEGQEMFSSCKRIMEGTFVGADLSLDLDELEKSASDVKDFSKKMTLKELKKSIMGDSDDYECKIK